MHVFDGLAVVEVELAYVLDCEGFDDSLSLSGLEGTVFCDVTACSLVNSH
jgi:hypothetical protein